MGQGRRWIIWAVAAVCLVGATAAGAQAAVAAPVPTFARTVVLTRVSGIVLIHVPGAAQGYVRLTPRPKKVPVGTMVDATAGRVRLT